jgi:GTP cyclohydrolase FolE2
VTLQAAERLVPTIATLSMTVALEATDKGTHMSRFAQLVASMLERLQAPGGSIEMRFPYFVRKSAPLSGVQSQLAITR